MSTLDYNTALKDMHEANNDFIQLLGNLHDFLTTNKNLSFYLGKETIVIEGLLALIDNYKNGQFSSVTIGTGDNSIVLSVTSEGDLKVSDKDGNLVGVVCSGISFSDVTDTTIENAIIKDCEIESVIGSVKVSGGSISLESLDADNLEATSVVARDISGTIAHIEKTHIRNMYIQGDRRMAFSNTRNIFYEDGVAIDNFAEKMIGGYSDSVWNWDDSVAKPSMLGLLAQDTGEIPELISICGNNEYSDFLVLGLSNHPLTLENVVAYAFVDNYPSVKVSLNNDDTNMSSVFLWPYASYETYAARGNKNLYVSEFRPEDIGKEVYYRTSGSSWVIYRTLVIHYNNQQAISASLDTPYTIPPYSCAKFIVNRTGSFQSGTSISILELA